MKRALTMVYHPQADGQTEIMNQTLEISLWAYVGPNRDNWVSSYESLIAKLRLVLFTRGFKILTRASYTLGMYFTYCATVFCSVH